MFLTEFDEEAYGKAMKNEGYEEGHEEGCEQTEKSYNLLISSLIEKDRMDDLKRATTDKAFRQQLFREFGIAK